MPLRHAAPSPRQLPSSLHRLAKEQSHRRPDFLYGQLHEGGKRGHRGGCTQEADLVRGIRGAHGGHETAETRDVWRTGGGRGLREGQEKERMGCFLDDLRAFGINTDQWTAAAQDEEGRGETAEQGADRFMAKWIAAEKLRAGIQHAVVCPDVTGITKERIAQSKRDRPGSLATVD